MVNALATGPSFSIDSKLSISPCFSIWDELETVPTWAREKSKIFLSPCRSLYKYRIWRCIQENQTYHPLLVLPCFILMPAVWQYDYCYRLDWQLESEFAFEFYNTMFAQGKRYSQFGSFPGSFQMYFQNKGWQLIKLDSPLPFFL